MLRLEVFDVEGVPFERGYLDPKSAELLRQQAYEEGYSAGWQDCVTSASDAAAARLSDAVDALQRLSFTYADARAMAERELIDLLDVLLKRVVPDVLAQALPLLVAQELQLLISRDLRAQLTLRGAPSTVSALGRIVAGLPDGAQVALVEEPAFAPSHVEIVTQHQRRVIDLNALLGLIARDTAYRDDDCNQQKKGIQQ
jgi:flagellar assembly protein FliH